MKRGEIYYATLDPTVGSEVKKKPPVVIISNNVSNKVSSTVTVLPITSNISQIYPFEVELPASISGLKKDSKIQCQHIRTISKLRIGSNLVGRINPSTLQKIQQSIELHLDF